MLAVDLGTPEYCLDVAKRCMENGLIVFWQLYKIIICASLRPDNHR